MDAAIPIPRSIRCRPRLPACAEQHWELSFATFLSLLLLHALLAVVMKKLPLVATAHALITLLLALVLAAKGASPARLLPFLAYITGAECLWRMTNVSLPWEVVKYEIVLILLVAMMRRGPRTPNWLPLLYFSLLLPSAFLTLGSGDWSEVRQDLSFNLSGPIVLAVSIFYFSGIRCLRLSELTRAFQYLLMPIAGICSIVSFIVLTSDNLVFEGRANNAAAGGASNQVSAILGLGVFVLFLLSVGSQMSKAKRACLVTIAIAFLAQSLITFSRSGIYLSAISVTVGILLMARDVKRTLVGLGLFGLIVALLAFLVWPALDRFTEGKLTERFQRTDSSGRGKILDSDIRLFLDHPLLGVGVGLSHDARAGLIGKEANAHTEFTRLIAEHGSLGLLALLVLIFMVCRNILRQPFGYRGAVVVGVIAWSLLFMGVSAMRMAAPAFLLGLSCVQLVGSIQTYRFPKAIRPGQTQRGKPSSRPRLVLRKPGVGGPLLP